MIGSIGLYNVDEEACRGEIGFDLLPQYWNRGYMSEAVRSIADWAFGTLGLNRLEAQVSPGNKASCNVLAKCGFVYEGHLRQRDFFRGRLWDSLMYGFLRPEWLIQ